MTNDDIIKLAREAGASFETAESMFRFANLVAEREREECAKVCEGEAAKRYDHARPPFIHCAAAIRARGSK